MTLQSLTAGDRCAGEVETAHQGVIGTLAQILEPAEVADQALQGGIELGKGVDRGGELTLDELKGDQGAE